VPSPESGSRIENFGKRYIVVIEDSGVAFIFDEEGIPIGYVNVKPGSMIEDLALIDIDAELIPLPTASVPKQNPKTGAVPDSIPIAVGVFCAFGALAKRRLKLKKRR
jgi:hypothetical protein